MIFEANKQATRQDRLNWYQEQGIDASNWAPVEFEIEGTKYQVDTIEAYDLNLPIELPDGRVFKVNGWFESMPPRAVFMEELHDLFLSTINTAKATLV